MKSIIPLLVIPVLAAGVLVGCNQNTPSSSTDTQTTNSSAIDASSPAGGATNLPVVSNPSDMNTNLPAVNSVPSVPDINTNMPAGTNQ
jgi:hypothetical protein